MHTFFRTHQRQNFRIQGYLIIIQIKSAILFAILAIPDNSDVHFHLQRQLHSINNGLWPQVWASNPILIIGFPSKANCRTSLNLEEK
jgi:hypothetical protein